MFANLLIFWRSQPSGDQTAIVAADSNILSEICFLNITSSTLETLIKVLLIRNQGKLVDYTTVDDVRHLLLSRGDLHPISVIDTVAEKNSIYLSFDNLDSNGSPKLCRKDTSGNITILG